MRFRWLGVAGIELVAGEEILAIDPYLTRAPFRNLWFGRVVPDLAQIRKRLPACDHLFVTHAHFDHVMDAAEVLVYHGAQGYGSCNACRLMAAMGASSDHLHVISCDDHLEAGNFRVQVFRQTHPPTPFDHWINAALSPELISPPLLRDYRMDDNFGFMIHAQGWRVLVGDLPVGADVLFTVPLKSKSYYMKLISAVQPKLVIPIHWDNLFLPPEKVRERTGSSARITFPGVYSYLERFAHNIETVSAGCRVLIPDIFEPYELEDELRCLPHSA